MPETATAATKKPEVILRPLEERDLGAADHIMRLAFGTFIGLPEPIAFMGDADYVRTRWRANPAAAFAAEVNGELVGSNFATNWGSVGFFGPLTIRPDFWDKGIGQRLMLPVMRLFEQWGTKHAGLFTFPHSTKHIALYQKFGFWPRFLTAMMSKPLAPAKGVNFLKFSEVSSSERQTILNGCHQLTNEIYPGLNVGHEIHAVATQNLGETVLLKGDEKVTAFAVCHVGVATEAGTGTCYIKFAAARSAHDFGNLLNACERMAAESGSTSRMFAGVNTARHESYRDMIGRGFRTEMQGVVMTRPNEPGYNHAGVYLIDDWR